MKKLLLLFLACISLNVVAINEEQAILVTQNFLTEKNITQDRSLSQISVMKLVKKDGMDMYYIMDLGNKEGFVIVSASEFLDPIIGYSFEDGFEGNPAVQDYLDNFSDYILTEVRAKNAPNPNITQQWEHFLQKDFIPHTTRATGVPALITTKWNQNKFYNTYCPWDIGSGARFDYRTPNGCVAIAAAQLMNYYRHPESGKGGMTYEPPGYPLQGVYLFQHKYNWDAMCDVATSYTNEIAKLVYHVGVMVKMGYGTDASGAFTDDLTTVLAENFYYTRAEPWDLFNIPRFKREIDSLRPVLFGSCTKDIGESDISCHAFLLDGYTEDPVEGIKFHFNWGWGGVDNGYYLLSENPFNKSGHTYHGIKPANNYPVQCQKLKVQTASQGYVTNGSTNRPYQKGPDCSWIIAAPKATRYTFSFSRLDTKEDIDVVTIYKGSTESSGVAATFSGSSTPAESTVVYADSVLITFTSIAPESANTKHRGFLMNYTTDKPQQNCDAVTQVTAPSGYITDGTKSGESYSPWSTCTWNFAQNYCTGIYGLFHEFDLKLGDFIEFYDASASPLKLWRRFDRYSPPTIGEVFTVPASKVQIKFITDNYDQGNGFKLQYFSLLSVNNNSLLDNLYIYPNPASDFINLSFTSELVNQPVICRLVDVTGREVYSMSIDYHGDLFYTQIPVAHLSKGFYFLQLVTKTGQTASKIIIN